MKDQRTERAVTADAPRALLPLVIVQSDEVAAMTAPLAVAACDRGVEVYDVSLRSPRSAINFAAYGPVFVYGSIALVHDWAPKQLGLPAWLFWNEQALSPVTWAKELGPLYLNSDGREDRAADVLTGWYARPIVNRKAFAGGIADLSGLDPEIAVWTAPPKAIEAEARLFVVGGRVVSGSLYQFHGAHVRDATSPLLAVAKRAATEMLRSFAPSPHCVLDVALTQGEWRAIEFNSINTSAWYAADPGAVLDAYLAAQFAPPHIEQEQRG